MNGKAPRGGIGSFLPEFVDGYVVLSEWTPAEWQTVNSGRAAIVSAIRSLRRDGSPVRLLVPDYYCWDVTQYLRARFEVAIYPSHPLDQVLPGDLRAEDLVLVPAYFGRRPPDPGCPADQVVLDGTHDPLAPWIRDYPCAAVVGSLRKTLPLPEGGFVSTQFAKVPHAEPGEQALQAALEAREAMAAKRRWIDGEPSAADHSWYQQLQRHEAAIADLEPSAMQRSSHELMSSLPAGPMRATRLTNLNYVVALLRARLPARITLVPNSLGLLLLLQTGPEREDLRSELISRRIYPAVLWPQPLVSSPSARDFADRMLLLHTDYRYGRREMTYMAEQIVDALSGKGVS